MKYRDKYLYVNCSKEEPKQGMTSTNGILGLTKETITISFLGRDPSFANQLIEDCRDIGAPLTTNIEIRVPNYSNWNLVKLVEPRSLNSVILANNITSTILEDINRFVDSQDWYIDKGIPYRRGYLLYGKPGNGKTSCIKALAGALKMDIYLLSLASPGMTDERLSTLLPNVPSKSILLIEDIDCAFPVEDNTNKLPDNTEKSSRKTKPAGLTFSGLLNAMDGVASAEGFITFMTTNHPERLDSALIRPGRVDMKIHIDNATKDQAGQIFHKFFPQATETNLKAFQDSIPDKKYNVATLQEYLILHRDSLIDALSNTKKLDELSITPSKENNEQAATTQG